VTEGRDRLEALSYQVPRASRPNRVLILFLLEALSYQVPRASLPAPSVLSRGYHSAIPPIQLKQPARERHLVQLSSTKRRSNIKKTKKTSACQALINVIFRELTLYWSVSAIRIVLFGIKPPLPNVS
jgi:hypothetical protein